MTQTITDHTYIPPMSTNDTFINQYGNPNNIPEVMDVGFIFLPPKLPPLIPGEPIKYQMGFSITLDSFQAACYKTAIYPETAKVIYPILGLLGEAGEVAEKARDYLFPNGAPKGWEEKDMFLKKVYHTLNDVAIAGISAGKTSKVVRDKNNELSKETLKALEEKVLAFTDNQKHAMGIETQDCAWFISTILGDMGLSLNEYGQKLLDKLQKRKVEGKLGGDGDNR